MVRAVSAVRLVLGHSLHGKETMSQMGERAPPATRMVSAQRRLAAPYMLEAAKRASLMKATSDPWQMRVVELIITA